MYTMFTFCALDSQFSAFLMCIQYLLLQFIIPSTILENYIHKEISCWRILDACAELHTSDLSVNKRLKCLRYLKTTSMGYKLVQAVPSFRWARHRLQRHQSPVVRPDKWQKFLIFGNRDFQNRTPVMVCMKN